MGRPLIGFSNFATGSHPGGWRLPDADARGTFSPATLRRTSQVVEGCGMDFLLLGDRLVCIPEAQTRRPFEVQRPEALTTAAFVAACTSRIGIVTTVNATYSEPYNVARAAAQLDHLSEGRIALNLVTGKNQEAAENFGRLSHDPETERYARLREYVEVLRRLWRSWEPGAVIADKEAGVLFDASKVHAAGFRGEHLSVLGALNIESPPQGLVPVVHAGNSWSSFEFGADHADMRYIPLLDDEEARAYYLQQKELAAARGRNADAYCLTVGITVHVAETADAARAEYRRLQRLSPVRGGVPSFERACGLAPDERRSSDRHVRDDPEFHERISGSEAFVRAVRAYGTDDLLISEVCAFLDSEKGRDAIVGGPGDVVDHIEARHGVTADAFLLSPASMPGGLDSFASLVMPELRRRGLAGSPSDAPRMFREMLGA